MNRTYDEWKAQEDDAGLGEGVEDEEPEPFPEAYAERLRAVLARLAGEAREKDLRNVRNVRYGSTAMNNANVETLRRTALYSAAAVTSAWEFQKLSRSAQEKAAKKAVSELNAAGVRRPNGARWDKNTVRVSV